MISVGVPTPILFAFTSWRLRHLQISTTPATAPFARHYAVNHSKGEYTRLGGYAHTNSAESYFALLKRGIMGNFHNISEAHLHRYLAEFDFRANTRKLSDTERCDALLAGAKGKRLMYRRPDNSAHA